MYTSKFKDLQVKTKRLNYRPSVHVFEASDW